MACNAKATTSAKVTNVILEPSDMIALAAALFGVNPSEILQRDYGYSLQFDYNSPDGLLALEQYKDGRGLRIGAPSTALATTLESRLTALATPYQQRAILVKLAALGALSQLQQKDNGVTARLTITI